MKYLSSFFSAVVLSLFAQQIQAEESRAAVLDQETLQPFLENYCIRCHGPEKQKGQIRFDQSAWAITDNDTAQRWQDVLDQLNAGDMPPEDEEQPSKAELSSALSTITDSVLEARRLLTDHGGEIKMRRLNKREYSQTIRDLFGFEIALDEIPSDGEIESFDTVGEEQFFTSAHLAKYLELGRKITTTALKVSTAPYAERSIHREHPEINVQKKLKKKVADSDRKRAMKEAGKTWSEMGFSDEGEMKILFSQWKQRVELPRKYLEYPFADTGVYSSDVVRRSTVSQRIDIRGDYLIHVHGGVVGRPHDLRKIVRIWDGNRIHGTLKMLGTPGKPETVSLRTRNPMGASHLSVFVRENQPDYANLRMSSYLKNLGEEGRKTDPKAALWFDWLGIEGPFYPDERPKFEELLYPGKPTGGRSPLLSQEKHVRSFIEQFATLAFRQKAPAPEYVDGLISNYRALRDSGVRHTKAIAETMAIILTSPSFLFIQEPVPAQKQPHGYLGQRELAIRLSYFLWSSPPDNELYAADLADPEVYAEQIDRMLASPKSDAFRDGFVSQWAEFERYDAITVDRKEHFKFNEGVQQDAKREVSEFFGTLIRENLPASHLIDSDFVTVNAALATHYGLEIDDSTGEQGFRKVMVSADSNRGGLLTQTAFLTTGSNGERSSPIIRGALIMEKILHDKPAPPPPNVPELEIASDKPATNREMVINHQSRATCASCHSKMDVIGFGLENFDSVGLWRDTEKIGKETVPIEPGGILPGGKTFLDVSELKAVLTENESSLAEELVESILAYGLGRTIEFSDTDDVEEILAAVGEERYRIGDIIREVALSDLFRKK